jgi:hypothetical protein
MARLLTLALILVAAYVIYTQLGGDAAQFVSNVRNL